MFLSREILQDILYSLSYGQQPLKKVCYAPACRSVLPFARGEWTRDQREKSAINERIPVDEKQPGALWTIHEVNIKRPVSREHEGVRR